MKRLIGGLFLLITVMTTVMVSGCTSNPASNEPADATAGLSVCPEERAQMCTMQYDPVCGVLEDGSKRTFSSDCVACSNPSVAGYEKGACESAQ